jgi:GNAT superfamily N-acetyltransferase
MAPVDLRDGRPEDLAIFQELFRELGVDDPPISLERFVGEIVPTLIVAERGGRVAGYAYYRPIRELSHLSQIVTAPDARRCGVGATLIREVIARSKAAGCTVLALNVKPENTAAIALYRSVGLEPVGTNHALQLPWSIIDALPAAATPHANDARPIDPSEDARLETAANLPAGLLAEQRTRAGRVFSKIEHVSGDGGLAVCVFDPAFPGAYPFRASDEAHALSLIRALRPHARPEHAVINLVIEAQPEIAQALLAAGAKLRMEILHMRGPI